MQLHLVNYQRSYDVQNDTIAQNWTSIVAANNATVNYKVNADLINILNSVVGIAGTVLGVVAIVAT